VHDLVVAFALLHEGLDRDCRENAVTKSAVEFFDDNRDLVEEWDDLADRVPGSSPALRPGWFEAWRSSFGRGGFEVFTARSSGRLTAIAPFERRRGALIAPANYHTLEYGILAENDDAMGEIVEQVIVGRPRRIQADLTHPGVGSQSIERACRDAGYRIISRVQERCPYVDTSGSWEAYEGTLTSKMRREMRRRWRLLSEVGDLELVVEDGTTGLDALLDEGFRIEAAAWKAAASTAILSSRATEQFYRLIASWAAKASILRLAFLRLDGRPLAFDFTLEVGGHHCLFKTGYAPSHRQYAPSILLRREMVKRAFDIGMDTYEFLGRDEPWKLRWTKTVRPMSRIQAFRPSPQGFVDWAAWTYGRPVAKAVRDRYRSLRS
jgi:CelD/BcsL family acetyltransferase involved in cellulose biosynthesis